ncbi:MAG: permease-like cell division protein FtsX [Oscillospiraceae bacterium]|jgi:cell division transport system permease protein|nr:permease-like cell division protein FtsX [Oscillospiraceae bacterium]
MSLASVMVMICCLLLTGATFIVAENIKFILKNIEGQNSITVYLFKDADLEKVKLGINNIENISSYDFYSKEEAIKDYEGMLGERVSGFFKGESNPLPDAFHVSFSDLSQYSATISEIMKIEGVDTTSDRSEIAEKLSNLKHIFAAISFWIVISLGAVSLLIISNTIRIAMHNRRFEINILRSIGATNNFIRLPFAIEGVAIGTFSATLSFFALRIIYSWFVKIANNTIPFNILPFEKFSNQMLIMFISMGLILGLIGGLVTIGKYLKKEMSEVVVW